MPTDIHVIATYVNHVCYYRHICFIAKDGSSLGNGAENMFRGIAAILARGSLGD
jgi:hypothetical protein